MKIVYIKIIKEMQKLILDKVIIFLILNHQKKKDLKKSNLMENFLVNIIKIFIIEECCLIKFEEMLKSKENMKEIKIKIILNILLEKMKKKEFIKKLKKLEKLMFSNFWKILRFYIHLNIKNLLLNLELLILSN